MTREMVNQKGEGMIFANNNEVLKAYGEDIVSLHSRIKLRGQDYIKIKDGFEPSSTRIVDTTVGRAIF